MIEIELATKKKLEIPFGPTHNRLCRGHTADILGCNGINCGDCILNLPNWKLFREQYGEGEQK